MVAERALGRQSALRIVLAHISAECDYADHRARHAWRGHGDTGCGGPVVSGFGGAAADAGMGTDPE